MDEELYLIYVHLIGTNHKGITSYEFIFSDTIEDIDGDEWDVYPAAGQPQPPSKRFIKKVGKLSTDEIMLDVIQ